LTRRFLLPWTQVREYMLDKREGYGKDEPGGKDCAKEREKKGFSSNVNKAHELAVRQFFRSVEADAGCSPAGFDFCERCRQQCLEDGVGCFP